MPTPHIGAPDDAFAEAVLLPGDPLRAEYIADRFLDDATQVTAVRNMLGFTGSYRGMAVSVMGTGMGVPSASIYITELIRVYGVERLVRVGSCGGISTDLGLRDIVLAVGACTDSGVNRARYGGWDFAATADYRLLSNAAAAGRDRGATVRVGNVHTSDSFYNPVADALATWQRMNVLAVEMEAAGLYGIAAEEGVRALAVLTVSDHVVTGAATSADERERSFDDMVHVALDALVKDEEAA
ncbi:MAG: purine-nucleoside phosphorylase [Acidimicrobiia bacterium]|nr:purine-nucleoside phosphorylase [Acidimicrobiia bacterium]